VTVGPVIENSKPPSPISRSRFGGRGMRIGLRAAVGVLIVVLLLVRAAAHALIDSLRHADAREVALAFLVLLAGLGMNAFRWQLFLRPLGLALPGRTLVRLTFVGTFFNAAPSCRRGSEATRTSRSACATGRPALRPPGDRGPRPIGRPRRLGPAWVGRVRVAPCGRAQRP
jgi:uncharacterized membrane protein YbhN (UPF0104 family)